MPRSAIAIAGAALFVSGLLGAGAAVAQEAQVPCDAYSAQCPTLPGKPIQGQPPAQPIQGQPPAQPGKGAAPGQGAGGGGSAAAPGTGGAQVPGVEGATQAGAVTGGTTRTAPSPRTLPFTGGDLVTLVLLGAGTVAAGVAALLGARSRASASA